MFRISSQDGQTPLLLAIRKKNTAMVRELVTAGVDGNYMEEVSDETQAFFHYSYICIQLH